MKQSTWPVYLSKTSAVRRWFTSHKFGIYEGNGFEIEFGRTRQGLSKVEDTQNQRSKDLTESKAACLILTTYEVQHPGHWA